MKANLENAGSGGIETCLWRCVAALWLCIIVYRLDIIKTEDIIINYKTPINEIISVTRVQCLSQNRFLRELKYLVVVLCIENISVLALAREQVQNI